MADDDAPGWDAIDGALGRLYPGVEPRHWGTLISYRLGGPDPLDGISAYPRSTPFPHWHFVTYGFSDLYEGSGDGATSGYGFELTMRVYVPELGPEAPTWPVVLLQGLARYVFSSGFVLKVGDYIDLEAPITDTLPTQLRGLAVAADPELGPIQSPFGTADFRQVVGLTADEVAVCKGWRTGAFLEALTPDLPLLLTDLGRPSFATRPRIQQAVAEGIRRDGSSTGALYSPELTVAVSDAGVVLTLTQQAVGDLLLVLPGRIPLGRALRLEGTDRAVIFQPGAVPRVVAASDGQIAVELTPPAMDALIASIGGTPGSYRTPIPGLTVAVV